MRTCQGGFIAKQKQTREIFTKDLTVDGLQWIVFVVQTILGDWLAANGSHRTHNTTLATFCLTEFQLWIQLKRQKNRFSNF